MFYKRKKIWTIILSAIMILSMWSVPFGNRSVKAASSTGISYRSHVQSIGWQPFVRNGATSGTEGKAKRMEAVCLKLEHPEYSGSIQYRVHVQSFGWQTWVKDGAVAGTTGKAKRLEAIQIKLSGDIANYYDIYYRGHVQHYGWSGWAKNGTTVGSTGYGYRMEAIQVKLVKKNAAAPGSLQKHYYGKSQVLYRGHVQKIGWQPYKADGKVSGTVGISKRLEAIDIRLNNKDYDGGIEYASYVQGIGWQGFVNNGNVSGTTGQGKRIEGLKIQLTGDMAKHYDVHYRVHMQSFGWMKWLKNGEVAGATESGKRIEAIQIILVEKGEAVVYPEADIKTSGIDPTKPMIALTYDDGPYSPVTNKILDSLEQVGGHATFFVVGNRVSWNSDVVVRANNMGCQIANHTWDHQKSLTSLSSQQINNQINSCNNAVYALTGKMPTVVRPVGGAVNNTVKSAVAYPMINWSLDTLDWKYRNADTVYNTVISRVKDGDVILMHDIHATTGVASQRLIPELVRRGFQLVTVDELAYYKGYNLNAHTLYTGFH